MYLAVSRNHTTAPAAPCSSNHSSITFHCVPPFAGVSEVRGHKETCPNLFFVVVKLITSYAHQCVVNYISDRISVTWCCRGWLLHNWTIVDVCVAVFFSRCASCGYIVETVGGKRKSLWIFAIWRTSAEKYFTVVLSDLTPFYNLSFLSVPEHEILVHSFNEEGAGKLSDDNDWLICFPQKHFFSKTVYRWCQTKHWTSVGGWKTLNSAKEGRNLGGSPLHTVWLHCVEHCTICIDYTEKGKSPPKKWCHTVAD